MFFKSMIKNGWEYHGWDSGKVNISDTNGSSIASDIEPKVAQHICDLHNQQLDEEHKAIFKAYLDKQTSFQIDKAEIIRQEELKKAEKLLKEAILREEVLA